MPQDGPTTKSCNPLISGIYGKDESPAGLGEAGEYPGQDPKYDDGHDDKSNPYQLLMKWL